MLIKISTMIPAHRRPGKILEYQLEQQDMKKFDAQQILFSPTGTTRKILESITSGLAPETCTQRDLTYSGSGKSSLGSRIEDGEMALIGMPVHAGRIPVLAVERLRASVQGKGRKAVLVVVYGNRAYEDALLELRNLAVELGFEPVAAAAFVGEHSFSTPNLPVGQGRPDKMDLEKALNFGRSVRKKMLKVRDADGNNQMLELPGNFPYREGVQPAPISPETDADACILCGDCVRSCPSAAITLTSDAVETDKMACLRCCACIRVCPTGARVMVHPRILELGRTLHEKFGDRREPELFF
jgi:ferredoxin